MLAVGDGSFPPMAHIPEHGAESRQLVQTVRVFSQARVLLASRDSKEDGDP